MQDWRCNYKQLSFFCVSKPSVIEVFPLSVTAVCLRSQCLIMVMMSLHAPVICCIRFLFGNCAYGLPNCWKKMCSSLTRIWKRSVQQGSITMNRWSVQQGLINGLSSKAYLPVVQQGVVNGLSSKAQISTVCPASHYQGCVQLCLYQGAISHKTLWKVLCNCQEILFSVSSTSSEWLVKLGVFQKWLVLHVYVCTCFYS